MALDIKSLSGGEVAGAGLFDELMRTTKAHLQQEFNDNRLVGADYANVYLGNIQSNMSAALQYLLSYEGTNLQNELIAEQVQGADLDNQLRQDQLLTNAKQRELIDAQIAVQTNNALKIVEETKLVTQQTKNAIAQETLIIKQVDQATAQIALIEKQAELLNGQIDTEHANTNTPTGGLTKVAYDKGLSEIAVLDQKLITETAQTTGTPDTVFGLVGQEISLKKAQGDSFLRDAEQKAAKFFSETGPFFAICSLTSFFKYLNS